LPSTLRERTHVFTMPAPGPDLFAQPDDFVRQVFAVMNREARHEFQVATCHVDRAYRFADQVSWGPNIWLGALIEDDTVAESIALLRDTPAKVHFAHIKAGASIPPFDVTGLDFVVVENAVEPAGFGQLDAACKQAGARVFLGPRLADAELRSPAETSTALATAPAANTRRR
jgi:protein gp37